MKRAASAALKKERKDFIIQCAVLAAICLIIIMAGGAKSAPKFTVNAPIDESNIPVEPDELRVEWEGAELPVESVDVNDDNRVELKVQPQDPGRYSVHVEGPGGEEVFEDELRVGPFGLTYSDTTGDFTGDNAIILGLTILFLGLAVLCVRKFYRLRGPLMFSYDSILTSGATLFCLITGINLATLFYNRIASATRFGMRDVYEQLSLSGATFMMLLFPTLLVFSLLMIVSNIALLRHERFRIHNVLGLGIGVFLILAGAFGIWMVSWSFPQTATGTRILYTLTSVYCTIFTYFECILIGAIVSGFRAARHVPAPEQDYILILGCGFRKDGSLSPLLKGRVDKALEFWKMQKEKTGKEAILIPSGGQGGDEPMPEAEAMGRYIRSCGIPDTAVWKEDKSTNTYQNMQFSKKLIEDKIGQNTPRKVMFTTTNYHVFRSGVLAGFVGLEAEGLGSHTKWWFWPNAFIRECAGLFVYRLRAEILWLIVLILIFGTFAMQII